MLQKHKLPILLPFDLLDILLESFGIKQSDGHHSLGLNMTLGMHLNNSRKLNGQNFRKLKGKIQKRAIKLFIIMSLF